MTFDGVLHDFCLVCRGLWRARTFSLAAVATLSVGTAGATLILALVQGVLLKPLPVEDQDRLIVAWRELPASSYEHYPFGDRWIEAVGRSTRLLQSVAGVATHGASAWVATDDATASSVHGALVTGRFFDVLGVAPVLGRPLMPADDVEGAEPVVVISTGLWRRRYGSSPDVIGRGLTLNEQVLTIVGVMPPDLDYPKGVEVWRTTRTIPTTWLLGEAARQEIDLIARLGPGITREQASDELTTLMRGLEAEEPPTSPRGFVPVVRPLTDEVVGQVRPILVSLLVAVGLVLLIACANAANLLLMRGESRRAELAVRTVLGASRTRLVAHSALEVIVLMVLATVAGLVIGMWSLQALLAMVPDGLPRSEGIRIDPVVVALVSGASALAALLSGTAPSFFAARVDPAAHLGAGGLRLAGRSSGRVRQGLVVLQVALALVVIAAAALLTRTVLRLEGVETGLADDRLVFLDLALPRQTIDDRARHARVLDEIVDSLEAVPGIDDVTPVNALPFAAGWTVPVFSAEGQSPAEAAANPGLSLEAVHAGYFEALGIGLVVGRAFAVSDREGSPDVAIVSEDVAAATWPGQNPVGKRLKMGLPASPGPWRTVIGVASSTRYRELGEAKPTLYLPARQLLVAARTLAVKTAVGLDLVTAAARERLRAIDPGAHVMRVAPFDALRALTLARPRFNALLLALFGGAALLLSTVGLYAVMATYVRLRDREIAVRVALGASPGRVRGLVLAEALRLSGLGVAVGLTGAIVGTRFLQTGLYQVDALDPVTLAGAAVLLVGVAGLAAYWPQRRAARLDPAATLRA